MRTHRGRPHDRPARALVRAFSAVIGAATAASIAGPIAPSAATASGPATALGRIESAVIAHPDDPDLAWALARELARAGRGVEALDHTQRFVARFPDRRSDAPLEIARTLLDHGAPVEAQTLLDDVVRRQPDSGLAHFYRGMALRANRSPIAAAAALHTAARLEPGLRSESLLLRALLLFDGGREREAVSLLQELLRVDPTSDTAVRARLLLRERELARGTRRLRAEADAGFEWDQNVTLEGAESETRPSDRADFRGIWGASLSGQPWLAERSALLLGYRYDQTHHVDLSEFDLIQNAIFASFSVQPSRRWQDRLALRFDAHGYDTIQDLDQALAGASFRPNVLWSFGRRAGVTRIFGTVELAAFDDDVPLDVWERDSISGGLGIEQTLLLPLRGASVAFSFAWLRSVTEADPGGSPDGFDGDFDLDSYRLRILGGFDLPWSIRGQIEATYSREEFMNDNFALWLDRGDFEPRQDDLASGRIALSRPILRFTRLELYWRGSLRASNVSVFDYDKNVVGLLVHVASD